MKNQLTTLATLALVSAMSAGLAQTTASGTTSKTTHKSTTARKAPVPKKPSVESQIQSLREDMQTQIQQLKQQLSDRDSSCSRRSRLPPLPKRQPRRRNNRPPSNRAA